MEVGVAKSNKKAAPSPLKIEQVPVGKLTHDPRNARLHNERNLDAIKASLRRFGQQKPIVVRKSDGVIIAGNGTLQAAVALGWEKVAVVYSDLDGTESHAFAVADNRTAELAEWDAKILAELVGDFSVPELNFDIGDIGFSKLELDKLYSDAQRNSPSSDSDDVAPIDRGGELLKKWKVKRGQVWQIGRHRLLCGDSTNAGDVALVLGGAKPNLMVTDPPYGVNLDPEWRADAGLQGRTGRMGKVTNDDRFDWTKTYALFPGGVAYVWHASSFTGDVQRNIQAAGFDIRACIVWGKNRMVLSRGHYHWQHEPCWYAVRKGATADWIGDRKQTTLWAIDQLDGDDQKSHGTQKPIECMARPIRNHSGDVYDPFLGSGTTMVAAEQLGRKCYGIEISESYCAVILERMVNHGLSPILEKR